MKKLMLFIAVIAICSIAEAQKNYTVPQCSVDSTGRKYCCTPAGTMVTCKYV